MRVDVMTKMRGVDSFPKLWTRRTTVSVHDSTIELMSLPDLVQAKKTQRDKDWPMVRRLVEVNYFANRENPTREQVRFWFLELRTPELLIELVVERGGLSTTVISQASASKTGPSQERITIGRRASGGGKKRTRGRPAILDAAEEGT